MVKAKEKKGNRIKIGVLDLGSIPSRSNALTYIQDKIDEAKLLDELNYSRFWVAEHHDAGSAWQSPEVVITLLAASTDRIRIGAAGVLLPIHNPLRIAQCYKLLNNLFNDRIDLGIAKSFPRNNYLPHFIEERNLDNLIENHFKRAHTILKLLKDDTQITMPPHKGVIPQIWILGNNPIGASFSIEHKLSVCYSFYHITSGMPTKTDFENYKNNYYKRHNIIPNLTLSLSILASNSKSKLSKMEENLTAKIGERYSANLKGDFSFVKDKLTEYQAIYNIDEMILINSIPAKREQFKLYEKIAELIN